MPTCFTLFDHQRNSLITAQALPTNFTYPFCYTPHPLATAACEQLQDQLTKFHPLNTNQSGRMYGVLVVRNTKGELGYLSALSGNNSDIEHVNLTAKQKAAANNINFVPMVFDINKEDAYFVEQQAKVNQLNTQIADLELSPTYIEIQKKQDTQQQLAAKQTTELQHLNAQKKHKRKQVRKKITEQLNNSLISEDEFRTASIELSRQSVESKKALATLKAEWQQKLALVENEVNAFTDEINTLKKARRKLSAKLQKRLFKQYQLLNSQGESKDLMELFKDTITPVPPAGTGDCAAPKLLQYAYIHQLTPICMAEFWWGKQPSSEIRKHGHYYPACQGKCQPTLPHMLKGLKVDANPLEINPAENTHLPIVYQDEHIVVVNKPANLLSVPGKSIEDSVYSRIKAQFANASGNLIVHRLDMATSGLLILALTERAHKHLQKQFIDKTISKQYVAVINGVIERTTEGAISAEEDKSQGKITLPLMLDINDRPRQKVCFEHGKRAETQWQVLAVDTEKQTTRVALSPITGRTHQLRVHCAHPDGLNMPIVGDTLYGTAANRLHLHAQKLSFEHPTTKERLTFEVEADF